MIYEQLWKAASHGQYSVLFCFQHNCSRTAFTGSYSQEFVIYSETGIDICLTMAYHHKFRHQNKKTTVYRLLVYLFSFTSITDVVSTIRKQQRFFPLFLLTATKSVLSRSTVKCCALLGSALSELRAPWFLSWHSSGNRGPISILL